MPASQDHITTATRMGANLVADGTTFRVWAPAARAVYINGHFGGVDRFSEVLTNDTNRCHESVLDMVNGELVEDADDDSLLDPQLCLPTGSAKHRDGRPRRLDKVEGSWFQAEENSADLTFDVRPVQGAGAGDLVAINDLLNLLKVRRPTRR